MWPHLWELPRMAKQKVPKHVLHLCFCLDWTTVWPFLPRHVKSSSLWVRKLKGHWGRHLLVTGCATTPNVSHSRCQSNGCCDNSYALDAFEGQIQLLQLILDNPRGRSESQHGDVDTRTETSLLKPRKGVGSNKKCDQHSWHSTNIQQKQELKSCKLAVLDYRHL